jgi:hypothetical protein
LGVIAAVDFPGIARVALGAEFFRDGLKRYSLRGSFGALDDYDGRLAP